jgi:hypothetical protein
MEKPIFIELDDEKALKNTMPEESLKTKVIKSLTVLNETRKSPLIFNASELSKQEKGRSKMIISSYLKPLLMGIIAAFAFFSIVKTNIDKLNTLKS